MHLTTSKGEVSMKVKNVEFDDVYHWDAPDYCDAFISYAEHEDGEPLSEEELDILNNNGSLKYELLMNYIY